MTWRELIDQYLATSLADDRNRLAAEVNGDRQKFIDAHGTGRFKQYEKRRLESNVTKTTESPTPPESYLIVDQEKDLIVAEVESAPNGNPFKLTRFRTVRVEGQWQLDD